jgi:hypothetical protein
MTRADIVLLPNTAPPRGIPYGHDVYDVHPIPPRARGQAVGVGAFSGGSCGLRLVPSKRRPLVPQYEDLCPAVDHHRP